MTRASTVLFILSMGCLDTRPPTPTEAALQAEIADLSDELAFNTPMESRLDGMDVSLAEANTKLADLPRMQEEIDGLSLSISDLQASDTELEARIEDIEANLPPTIILYTSPIVQAPPGQCRAEVFCPSGTTAIATQCLLGSGSASLQNATGGTCIYNCGSSCTCQSTVTCI